MNIRRAAAWANSRRLLAHRGDTALIHSPSGAKVINASSEDRMAISCEILIWFDEVESFYLTEMASVECGYLTTSLQSRCPYNQVIEAHHLARDL
jgi:hypothetical protein